MSDADELRAALVAAIADMPVADAARLVIDAARALLDRRTAYAPAGADLIRLVTHDETVTVVVAGGRVAPMLAVAHDALKRALGAGEPG